MEILTTRNAPRRTMVLSVNGLSLPPLTEIAFVRGCVLTNETPIVGMQGRCALNGRTARFRGRAHYEA
ncbi:hypothetical protein CEXT_617921 [Caerostris extrusa]|uniref:Uncharacterized protein n=1 Tax=Caerostris extrusa TaxID=172846 RepID=A0AAV4MQN3_CAEEX|nr:hypothetical protein CEXT_617921 [Caerostris extrusa]